MLLTGLLEADILKEQPGLNSQEFVSGGFDDYITDSYYEVTEDLINKNLDVKKLGTELVLAVKAAYNVVTDHDVSRQDFLNRQLLILVISIDGSTTHDFELLGSDAEDGTFTSILTFSTVSGTLGTYKQFIPDIYSFYQLKKTDADTATYSCSIVESVYFYLHLYKTIKNIYKGLSRKIEDFFHLKQIEYEGYYSDKLSMGKMSYDLDDDNIITASEADKDTRTWNLTL